MKNWMRHEAHELHVSQLPQGVTGKELLDRLATMGHTNIDFDSCACSKIKRAYNRKPKLD